MNCKVLIFALLLFYTPLFSQSSTCGTEMPENMMNWLKAYKQQPINSANKIAQDGPIFIPLAIHIVGTDEGGGYYKVQDLMEALCHLNEQYEPVGFFFYIFGEINYINNSDVYEHTSSWSISGTIQQNNVSGAANLYFVQDPAGNCGYFSGGLDFIMLRKSCSGPNNSTIAHELGHYFSLPHTFYGWEGRDPYNDAARFQDERVNGSNCNFAGDYFCDTPADYISDRWSCPYSRTKQIT